MIDLENKVALVTGAGTGIGRGCAQRLAEAGAKVIAVARTESDLATLEKSYPDNIEYWVEDINDVSFFVKLAALEKLDILLNNAGTNDPQPFIEVDTQTLDTMININVRATFLVAQAAARIMKREGGGSIINMSSQMGHVGYPGRTVYCMTKHAVEGLTKSMAVELAEFGIRVNSVAPTFVETPLTTPMFDDDAFKGKVFSRIPMGKLAQIDDVADAVLFLASDQSKMITGDSLKVDGGWTAQ